MVGYEFEFQFSEFVFSDEYRESTAQKPVCNGTGRADADVGPLPQIRKLSTRNYFTEISSYSRLPKPIFSA